jgi:hypothetical protein
MANKMLAAKSARKQRANYKSSGGYPIGDVAQLTDLGGYNSNKNSFNGRNLVEIIFLFMYFILLTYRVCT